MPIRDGYVDASAGTADPQTRATLESFGYEWTTFDKIQLEDEAFWTRYFRDVPLDELDGKIGLDAGCGKGRFSYFIAPHLNALVALDGSDAVQAAVRNLSSFDNVAVVKTDIRVMPFVEGAFDFVCCLGVLHHLDDPDGGFEALTKLLAPNGRLLIYVYSRPESRGARWAGLAAAALLRRVTVRMPRVLVRAMSAPIAALLYVFVVLPGSVGDRVGVKRLSALPLGTYRRRPVRSLWLDTFDRLSAPIEKRYVWQEIEPWFRDAGLQVESVRDDAGLIVLARATRAQHAR